MALTLNQFFQPGAYQALPLAGYEAFGLAELFGDNSYPTGGWSLSGVLPFSTTRLVAPMSTNLGLVAVWDQANQKIKVFYPTGGGTAAPTTVGATAIVTSGASTASAVSATTPAITPGVGKEVGNTADLSTLKIYAFVAGKM